MKKNVHPAWHHDAVVTCSCGNTFTTGATVKTMQVDICSACHPFFTGEMRFVDRQGRVDKFMAKMKKAQAAQATKKAKKAKAKKEEVKSYQEILRDKKSTLNQVANTDESSAKKVEAKPEAKKADK